MEDLVLSNNYSPRKILIKIDLESFEKDRYNVLSPNNSVKKFATLSVDVDNKEQSDVFMREFIDKIRGLI